MKLVFKLSEFKMCKNHENFQLTPDLDSATQKKF